MLFMTDMTDVAYFQIFLMVTYIWAILRVNSKVMSLSLSSRFIIIWHLMFSCRSVNYHLTNIIKYDDIWCDDLIILGIALFSGSNRDVNDIWKDMCHRGIMFVCICLIKHKRNVIDVNFPNLRSHAHVY